MKKYILLLIIFTLSNCSSTKKIESEAQHWINAQNFTIIKPNNWRAIKHHGYVGYTPLKKESNFFNNLVSIFQFELEEKPSFKILFKNHIKESNEVLNITSQEILEEKNRLGNTFIHKYESNWNGEKYKKYIMYFEHNGEYYCYSYSSLKNDYNKHFKEAMSILNSIEFK